LLRAIFEVLQAIVGRVLVQVADGWDVEGGVDEVVDRPSEMDHRLQASSIWTFGDGLLPSEDSSDMTQVCSGAMSPNGKELSPTVEIYNRRRTDNKCLGPPGSALSIPTPGDQVAPPAMA
jgi:hypothetical protein